jgi:hypothetical protein
MDMLASGRMEAPRKPANDHNRSHGTHCANIAKRTTDYTSSAPDRLMEVLAFCCLHATVILIRGLLLAKRAPKFARNAIGSATLPQAITLQVITRQMKNRNGWRLMMNAIADDKFATPLEYFHNAKMARWL